MSNATKVPRRNFRRTSGRHAEYPHLNYDQKYHPLDDAIKPANAKKRKRFHGLAESDDHDESVEDCYDYGDLEDSDQDEDTGYDEKTEAYCASQKAALAPKRGTRKSCRTSTNQTAFYDCRTHPQDDMLAEAGVRRKRSAVLSRQKTFVLSDDDEEQAEVRLPDSSPQQGASVTPLRATNKSAKIPTPKSKRSRKHSTSQQIVLNAKPVKKAPQSLPAKEQIQLLEKNSPLPEEKSQPLGKKSQSVEKNRLTSFDTFAQAYTQAWEEQETPAERATRQYAQAWEAMATDRTTVAPLDTIHGGANSSALRAELEVNMFLTPASNDMTILGSAHLEANTQLEMEQQYDEDSTAEVAGTSVSHSDVNVFEPTYIPTPSRLPAGCLAELLLSDAEAHASHFDTSADEDATELATETEEELTDDDKTPTNAMIKSSMRFRASQAKARGQTGR